MAGDLGMHIQRSERSGLGSGVVGDCLGESGLPLDMTRVCLGPLGCHGYDNDLSQPCDSVEPCTNLEAPPQFSSPFVTPPLHHSLLHSMEHCTSSIYSNYVPLCLQLLFPSVPVCYPLPLFLL